MSANMQLGKYEIIEEIGRGGFATVYRALDPTLDREIALKLLHPHLSADHDFVERFQREARVLARLRHPHIVTVYEVGETDSRLYIAMELVRGPSLASTIAERGSIPWQETLALLEPMCEALGYAHRQRVVHRDLKPANVLLDRERGPLLVDFGISRVVGTSSVSITTGAIVGTPPYIAPEVWERDAAEAPADIYALGCIVYEMLTGEVLFSGTTPMQIMRAHDRGPQFPDQWPEGVPQGLDKALGNMIALDPRDRPGNVNEIAESLKKLGDSVTPFRARDDYLAGQEAVARTRYRSLDLLIDSLGSAGYRVHVIGSPAGEASDEFVLPLAPEDLNEAWQRLEAGQSDEPFLRDLGARLFDALFQGNVGRRFRSSQSMLETGEGLSLRFRIMSGELFSIPWELLYDPERRIFLGLAQRMSIVRYLPGPHSSAVHPVSPPLQMLAVFASPKDLPALDVQREIALLRQTLQPLVDESKLTLDVLQSPTPYALSARLASRPYHILHFLVHSNSDFRGGYIYLEDADGRGVEVHASELKSLFTGDSLRLVVLDACLTARDIVAGTSEQAYLGVAPALVDAGVPTVVAMQFAVSDRGGRAFAQGFYRTLAQHKSVEEAVAQARVATMLEMGLGSQDWVSPVLFLRGNPRELFPAEPTRASYARE